MIFNFPLAHVKFPEGTVAGLIKSQLSVNPHMDIIRVNNQGINWTLSEIDVSFL